MDTQQLDETPVKRGRKPKEDTKQEVKVGTNCLYWMQFGGQLVPFPAIVVGQQYGTDNWELVRFQPVVGNAAVPVYGAHLGTEPANGIFTVE